MQPRQETSNRNKDTSKDYSLAFGWMELNWAVGGGEIIGYTRLRRNVESCISVWEREKERANFLKLYFFQAEILHET